MKVFALACLVFAVVIQVQGVPVATKELGRRGVPGDTVGLEPRRKSTYTLRNGGPVHGRQLDPRSQSVDLEDLAERQSEGRSSSGGGRGPPGRRAASEDIIARSGKAKCHGACSQESACAGPGCNHKRRLIENSLGVVERDDSAPAFSQRQVHEMKRGAQQGNVASRDLDSLEPRRSSMYPVHRPGGPHRRGQLDLRLRVGDQEDLAERQSSGGSSSSGHHGPPGRRAVSEGVRGAIEIKRSGGAQSTYKPPQSTYKPPKCEGKGCPHKRRGNEDSVGVVGRSDSASVLPRRQGHEIKKRGAQHGNSERLGARQAASESITTRDGSKTKRGGGAESTYKPPGCEGKGCPHKRRGNEDSVGVVGRSDSTSMLLERKAPKIPGGGVGIGRGGARPS